MDFHTFDDHVETDPDNTDLEYITNIHSNTLEYTLIYSNTLKYTHNTLIHSNTLYVNVMCVYIDTLTLTYTQIHSNTHITLPCSVFECK